MDGTSKFGSPCQQDVHEAYPNRLALCAITPLLVWNLKQKKTDPRPQALLMAAATSMDVLPEFHGDPVLNSQIAVVEKIWFLWVAGLMSYWCVCVFCVGVWVRVWV